VLLNATTLGLLPRPVVWLISTAGVAAGLFAPQFATAAAWAISDKACHNVLKVSSSVSMPVSSAAVGLSMAASIASSTIRKISQVESPVLLTSTKMSNLLLRKFNKLSNLKAATSQKIPSKDTNRDLLILFY